MTVHTPGTEHEERYAGPPMRPDEDRGEGWLTFSAIVLTTIGLMNFVYGIAAIDNANFYIADAEFVVSDLNTWGWAIMITGVVQVLAAIGILARNQFARWLGVGFASLNMLAQLMMIAAFPLWSLAIFSVDLLVIYGLVVYGGRMKRAA